MKVQAIEKREDVSPKEGKSQYGDVDFADEKNKKYPIDTEGHIRAAWNYINKEANAAKYSSGDVASIKRKIIAAWKKRVDKEGPPSAQASSKAESQLIFCDVATDHFEGKTPAEIVYMPKGKWNITPLVGGQRKEVTVEVDANAAARLATDLGERFKSNVRPHAGFGHDPKGPASFLPKAFKWDDTRGVVLEVDWTDAGKAAISGRNYSYFSPTFLLDGNRVAGLPDKGEIGSLTNTPAFEQINKIAASSDGGGEPDMSKIANKLVELEVITAEAAEGADEEFLIRAINGLHEELASTQAANARLSSENTALATKVQAIQKSEAESVIEAAIAEGKIGAKDKVSIDFYLSNYVSNPEGTKRVLAAMPANPVLNRIIDVKVSDSAKMGPQSTADLIVAQRRAADKVQAANPGMSWPDAFNEAREQSPHLFPKEN